MEKKYLKGSYTVEAAAVVSITFFVLAAFIICAFYIHDREVLQSAACEAAVAGSNFSTEDEGSAAAKKIKSLMKTGRLLGSRGLDGYVAVESKQVQAAWRSSYPVPGFAAKYLSGSKLNISVSWKSKRFDPADTIRKIRGAGELLSGGST